MKNKFVASCPAAVAGLLIACRCHRPAVRQDAWVRIIDIALLYVMLALGLNIVVGYAGLLDLGYVAFYAVGATCSACWPRRTCGSSSRGPAMSPNGLHTPLVGAGRSWRRWPACCWARRRCGCAATTWPSSRWASARSSACS